MYDILKAKYPFEEYLKQIHSKNYMGTDDDMPDSFENWVADLDNEFMLESANSLSKILVDYINNLKK